MPVEAPVNKYDICKALNFFIYFMNLLLAVKSTSNLAKISFSINRVIVAFDDDTLDRIQNED